MLSLLDNLVYQVDQQQPFYFARFTRKEKNSIKTINLIRQIKLVD